jgi:hypothetical protein
MATTNNGDVAQRRYGVTTKLLRYIGAALCGFSLVEFGAALTANQSIMILKYSYDPRPGDWADLTGYLFACLGWAFVFAMTFGVACGRFLQRAFPPVIADRGSRSQTWKLAACAIVFIGLYTVTVLLCVAISADMVATESAEQKTLVVARGLALSLPFVVLWVIAAMGVLIHRHRQRRAFLDQPFVLFLRRFSTFADRAVVALILSQVRYNVPVVFLTPTLSRAGDWDPFIVGFAGLKVWHPWRSAPIVIRARDEAWRDAADELIRHAKLILLDVSETSGALRTEAEMLDKAGRWPETVCLRLTVPGKIPAAGFGGVRTIDYTKSWVRALPRMAMGLLILVFVAEFFFMAVSAVLPLLLALVATLILVGWYYYSIFGRPAINRKAKVELRTVLPAWSVEAPQGIGGWLVLPIIVLIIAAIGHSYLVLTQYWPIFRDGAWEQLTTPGTAAYHYLWGPMIAFESAGSFVLLVIAIATLVLLFRKSKKTRAFAIAFFGISIVYNVFDYLADLIPAVAEQSGPDDVRRLIWIIFCALWIAYFIFSRRVKASFVR